MQHADRPAFVEMIEQTARLYGKKIDLEVLGLYWEDLRDFEFLDVKDALRLHRQDLKAGKYMPKPADIIQQLRGEGKQKTTQPIQDLGCSVERNGKRCRYVGTLCETIGAGGNWICREHWRARGDEEQTQKIVLDSYHKPQIIPKPLTALVDEIVALEKAECIERGITGKQLYEERKAEMFGKKLVKEIA